MRAHSNNHSRESVRDESRATAEREYRQDFEDSVLARVHSDKRSGGPTIVVMLVAAGAMLTFAAYLADRLWPL